MAVLISMAALEWPPLRLQHLLIPERLPVLSVTKGLECRPDGTLVPIPAALLERSGRSLSLNAVGGRLYPHIALCH